MNQQERKLLEGVYRDYLALKRRGELTEFGKGQLMLCRILINGGKQNGNRY